MKDITFRFLFQNSSGLPFTKWANKFDIDLADKKCRIFLFCDKSIANGCFVKSVISNRSFINVFFSNNVLEELPTIETFIKRHCESMLLKGMFSECKLDFDSEKHKDLVLRDYEYINLFEIFDDNWRFYTQNKPKLFYKLADYYPNLCFSYLWSLFFTEKNSSALVMDNLVMNNSHLFKKYINIDYQAQKEKKYKIIYYDTNGLKINIVPLMEKLEQNGLLLLKNLDVEGPNMVGWRDLKNRMIGLVKI
jgi:hypothetical protein